MSVQSKTVIVKRYSPLQKFLLGVAVFGADSAVIGFLAIAAAFGALLLKPALVEPLSMAVAISIALAVLALVVALLTIICVSVKGWLETAWFYIGIFWGYAMDKVLG